MKPPIVSAARVAMTVAICITALAGMNPVATAQIPGPRALPGTPHAFGGHVHWTGRVDAVSDVHIQGARGWITSLSFAQPLDSHFTFTGVLPNRSVHVRLTRKHGRGHIEIVQQPSGENGYTAVVRISDTPHGHSNYRFTLVW